MDTPSHYVATFLETLQDAMQQLTQLQHHYFDRGTRPDRPFLFLSGRPFSVYEGESVQQVQGSLALGLHIRGGDGREYELAVDVLWDAECWTITTEAWVEADTSSDTSAKTGGQELLRQLPKRRAVDLEICTKQVRAAVEDLAEFDDLVPSGGSF
jgi:hypothetical protein